MIYKFWWNNSIYTAHIYCKQYDSSDSNHDFYIYNIRNKESEHRPFWGHKLCEVASVKVLPTFNNFILQIQMPIGEHSLNEYFSYNVLLK